MLLNAYDLVIILLLLFLLSTLCTPIQSGVDELQCQFSAYEQSQAQVEHILQYWDRDQGLLLVPLPSEEAPLGTEDVLTEKQVSLLTSSKTPVSFSRKGSSMTWIKMNRIRKMMLICSILFLSVHMCE